jgi:hypothetical protein
VIGILPLFRNKNRKKTRKPVSFYVSFGLTKNHRYLKVISAKSEQADNNVCDEKSLKINPTEQGQLSMNKASNLSPRAPSDSAPQYANIICIDHNGAWYHALKKINFLKDVSRHAFSEIDEFNPDSKKPCVVILHGNPPDSENSAVAWKDKLKKLHEEKRILRVIVASAGGHPRDKGIAKDECFVFAELKDQGIQVQDIQELSSPKRSHFLNLLSQSYKNE